MRFLEERHREKVELNEFRMGFQRALAFYFEMECGILCARAQQLGPFAFAFGCHTDKLEEEEVRDEVWGKGSFGSLGYSEACWG